MMSNFEIFLAVVIIALLIMDVVAWSISILRKGKQINEMESAIAVLTNQVYLAAETNQLSNKRLHEAFSDIKNLQFELARAQHGGHL